MSSCLSCKYWVQLPLYIRLDFITPLKTRQVKQVTSKIYDWVCWKENQKVRVNSFESKSAHFVGSELTVKMPLRKPPKILLNLSLEAIVKNFRLKILGLLKRESESESEIFSGWIAEMPLRKPPKTLLNLSLDAIVKHLSSYITRWRFLWYLRCVCLVLCSFARLTMLYFPSESLAKVASSLTSQNPQNFSWQSKWKVPSKTALRIFSLTIASIMPQMHRGQGGARWLPMWQSQVRFTTFHHQQMWDLYHANIRKCVFIQHLVWRP